MAIRYDKSRWALRPWIEIYGWVVACLMYAFFQILRWTGRLEIKNKQILMDHPHAIWACWHEFVVCAFVALPDLLKTSRPQVWLNHPAWTMRPIHHLMRLYGVDVIMGASGERGREAALALNQRVRAGASTSLNPDGPAGPKHILKRGIITLAVETGIPVLAFQYQASRSWHWPGWDRKVVPFPFSKIEVTVAVVPPEAVEVELARFL